MKLGLATRLTLLNAGIVALTCVGVVALMVTLTDGYMEAHVEESVIAELDVLVADYVIDGLKGVEGFIDIRQNFNAPQHGRVYRLESADGRHLAGGWPQWPARLKTDGSLIRVPNLQRRPATEWLMAAAELPDGSRVMVGFDRIEHDTVMRDVYRAAAIGLGLALALSLALGALIHRAALQPIATIRRSAETIIDGDLSHRIPHDHSRDEFGALSATLNRMLDRIEQLIAGVRGTSDAIAHDLRSPLTRHRARVEAALRQPPSPETLSDWLHDTLGEIDQVLGTFNALLQLATVEAGVARAQFADVSMTTVLQDAVSLYDAEASERNMTLALSLPDARCMVRGDRHLLFQCVINLLDNALKYGPAGQTVGLSLHCDADAVVIDITDEGPGVAQPDLAFNRMVRGDVTRQTAGHGLGLTLVRAIARLHGGDAVVVHSHRGARLRVSLPMH